jgi:hypothetical protein
MNNIFSVAFVLVFISAFYSCKEGPEENTVSNDKTTEIVHNSINYYDTFSLITSLKAIKYTLTTKLYNDWGGIEDSIFQKHHYELTPLLSGTIEWNRKDSVHSIHYKNGLTSKFVNNTQVLDSLETAKAYSAFVNSFYSIMMPFQLTNEDVFLKYEGREIKPLIGPADIVSVSFDLESNPELPQNELNLFYFDPDNQKCLANKISQVDSMVLHINKREQEVGGIKFIQYRKSYNFDNVGKIDRLRAEYIYHDISLEFQK